MSFFVFYPPSGGGSSTNPSIGPNNDPIPLYSTLIAGENPSGDLTPVQTDANGYLITTTDPAIVQHVIVDSSVLPTGAATESTLNSVATTSNETADNTLAISVSVASIDTKTPALVGGSVPVTASSLPLPIGAATAANQTNVQAVDGGTPPASALVVGGVTAGGVFQTFETNGSGHLNVADGGGSLTVDNNGTFPVQATISAGTAVIGQVSIDQTTPGTTNGVQINAALPVGTNSIGQVTANAGTNLNTSALNLETTQAAMSAKLPATLGQKDMASSMAVAIASDQSSIPVTATIQAGSAVIGKVSIDQTTPGTTNGVQVNAALPAGSNIIGALVANQSVNNAQIAGVAVSTGNGVVGTGVQRVAIASDNTPFSVNTTEQYQSGSTGALSSASTTALAASLVIKGSAGRLYQLTGMNLATSTQYIQVFNSTTLPADTTVPILSLIVPANTNFSFDLLPIGKYFSTGIVVCNSSTAASKTIGSANCWFNAEYL